MHGPHRGVGCGPGGYQGGYTGWVIPGVGTGTTQPHCSGRGPYDSEAGPGRALQGPWSGWSYGARANGRRDGHIPTLRARSGPEDPPWDMPSECRPGTNTARFHYISYKVSQNGKVSPKNIEKACHSPYFQNGTQNSPLGIPSFPFSSAFSHKELMVLFAPNPDFYVKMTKCRRMCTPGCHAKGSPDTPTDPARQARSWGPLLIWLSAGI